MDLRKLCRLCFVDNALVDITEHRASACPELTILQLLHAIYGEKLMLDVVEKLPMICNACLDECLQQYAFFRKLRTANQQLLKLYHEAQKELECPEQEELQATEEEDTLQEFDAQDLIVLEPEEENRELEQKPSQGLANHDSLIVSEFLPSTTTQVELGSDYSNQQQEATTYEMRTVDYAAVELKHYNLDEYNEANRLLDVEPSGSQAVYKCQYCPLAYASPQYLKTHVRSSHVCKYCTMAFAKVRDLNEHIRSNHSDHQCVVCSNSFSTSSNLRAHLKRVHGVQLPAQVALLDYRPASADKDNPRPQ
ncbi:transcription factor E4F1 [Drosophila bipectinata]|uniref:transcription factor E4F1 n=1 Tax=Drosophila bipectinata TaxID=42026 RepID=UPI001C8A4F1E|nr:zinc finger protein 526 [Drosophila bipectinata]